MENVNKKHPATAHDLKSKKRHRRPSTVVVAPASTLSEPRSNPKRLRLQHGNFRHYILSFIVSNNLPILLVERQSFIDLIHISPATNTRSARTLRRKLSEQFHYHCELLRQDLLTHIRTGGRLSLTTDSWAARSHQDSWLSQVTG